MIAPGLPYPSLDAAEFFTVEGQDQNKSID